MAIIARLTITRVGQMTFDTRRSIAEWLLKIIGDISNDTKQYSPEHVARYSFDNDPDSKRNYHTGLYPKGTSERVEQEESISRSRGLITDEQLEWLKAWDQYRINTLGGKPMYAIDVFNMIQEMGYAKRLGPGTKS